MTAVRERPAAAGVAPGVRSRLRRHGGLGGLARHVAVSRRAAARPVLPRLRAGARTGPPVAWFACPDWDLPSGGVRAIYRKVDLLAAAGYAAAVVHTRPGFACTWFPHATRVVPAPAVRLRPDDLVVVPELYASSMAALPPGVRRVVFNQNVYRTFAGAPATGSPYTDDPDLVAALVVSEANADYLRHAFPALRVEVVRNGVDPRLFHVPPARPGRRLALVPSKRPADAAQLLALLRLRGVLDGWEVVPIDWTDEATFAATLRATTVFVALGVQEGFGLPAAEAMACGCAVVGFSGFGGRELFDPSWATEVSDGDVLALARAVEALLARCDRDPQGVRAEGLRAAAAVAVRYSPAAERADVLRVLGPLLDGGARS